MPKLKPDPITAADLADYLATESDFGFEIRVVNELQRLRLDVLHGGTYEDAVSGKPRQFDVRAMASGIGSVLRLAVECKNLRPNFPLLVSCLPRTEPEAYQDVALSINVNRHAFVDAVYGRAVAPATEPCVRTIEAYDSNSIYRMGDPVGKTLAQVGRDGNGDFTAGDSEVYGKWSQALSSADDLVSMCPQDARTSESTVRFSIVVPVLVVPDEMLWMCAFDLNGNRTIEPTKVDRVSYFVGKVCSYREAIFLGSDYRISHLEIVTLSGLAALEAMLTRNQFTIPTQLAQSTIRQYVRDR